MNDEARERGELDAIERLRVVAAIGGTVTLDADAIRAILRLHSISQKFSEDGFAAYERAQRLIRVGVVTSLASLAWLVFWFAAYVWWLA